MGGAPGRLGEPTDDGKRLRACEKRLELQFKAKPKIGGCWGEAPGSQGKATDDGKRLRACEKRLELQCKAKPKYREGGGESTGSAGEATDSQARGRLFYMGGTSRLRGERGFTWVKLAFTWEKKNQMFD